MTQDEIIEMAREAGFNLDGTPNMLYIVLGNYAQLEAFAKLVAAKAIASEREACAKVCEDLMLRENPYERWEGMKWCMDKIRARGEQA